MMEISDNYTSMSDASLLLTIGGFVKHHRLSQNKSQQELANDAGISRRTLNNLEARGNISLQNLVQLLRVLDLLYVMEIFEVKEQISPLLLAKMAQNKRRRASSKPENEDTKTDW